MKNLTEKVFKMALIASIGFHISMIPSYISFFLDNVVKDCDSEILDIYENDDFIVCNKIDKLKYEIFKSNCFWSHRHICVSMDIWPYQITNNMIKKGSPFSYILRNRITLNMFDLTISSFYISNYKSWNPERIQISNFIITQYSYSTINKNYKIENSNDFSNLRRVSSHNDKIICAKYLIFLLNEVNNDYVPLENYSLIVYWLIDQLRNLPYEEKINILPKGWY